MLMYPIDLVKASGVARSMNFVSNIAALTVFVVAGHVDWVIGLTMGFAVMVGAFLAPVARSVAAPNSFARYLSPSFWD